MLLVDDEGMSRVLEHVGELRTYHPKGVFVDISMTAWFRLAGAPMLVDQRRPLPEDSLEELASRRANTTYRFIGTAIQSNGLAVFVLHDILDEEVSDAILDVLVGIGSVIECHAEKEIDGFLLSQRRRVSHMLDSHGDHYRDKLDGDLLDHVEVKR